MDKESGREVAIKRFKEVSKPTAMVSAFIEAPKNPHGQSSCRLTRMMRSCGLPYVRFAY